MSNKIINQFWYELSNKKKLSDRTIQLMKIIIDKGYKINFWSYQNFKNIPKGVIIKDANDIIKKKEFDYFRMKIKYKEIKKGTLKHKIMGVVHLSDMFRALLLHKKGGWWLDTDVILLKKLPKISNIISTLPRRVTGTRAKKLYHFKHQKTWDMNASVLRSTKGSKWTIEYYNRVKSKIMNNKKLNTYFELDLLAEYLNESKQLNLLAPPIMFNPIPTWTYKTGVTSFGYKIPTHTEIMNKSYTVSLSGIVPKKNWKKILKKLEIKSS